MKSKVVKLPLPGIRSCQAIIWLNNCFFLNFGGKLCRHVAFYHQRLYFYFKKLAYILPSCLYLFRVVPKKKTFPMLSECSLRYKISPSHREIALNCCIIQGNYKLFRYFSVSHDCITFNNLTKHFDKTYSFSYHAVWQKLIKFNYYFSPNLQLTYVF